MPQLRVQATNQQLRFALLDDRLFQVFKGVNALVWQSQTKLTIIKFDLNDKRLIETKDVLSGLTEKENLASIPWEDFEHLVVQVLVKSSVVQT